MPQTCNYSSQKLRLLLPHAVCPVIVLQNQICVGGDVVLFIMFYLNYNK